MQLIIAEKPDVMKKIARSLDGTSVKYYKGYAQSNSRLYTHCVGHLLSLKKPAEIDETLKSWNLNSLPFIFKEIPLTVSDTVKEQYTMVKKLLNDSSITEVINACDADREGELIFRNVYYFSKAKCKNVSRMWIKATTESSLKETFETREKMSLYNNIYEASKVRSYADYLIGMNATRGMTVKYASNKQVLTIGRVQTPTLRMIVDIENEINSFVSKTFYKINAICENDNDLDDIIGNYINPDLDDNRFYDLKDAQKMVDKIGLGTAIATSVDNKTKKEKPKLLYSLSDLQMEMNKRYNFSPSTVLEICQSLYEKHGLLTYPRTDSTSVTKEFSEKLTSMLTNYPMYREYIDEIKKNNWKMNSNVVSSSSNEIGSHEAITPVADKVSQSQIDGLNDVEKKVYLAVVERLIQSFYPDAVYNIQKIIFERNGEQFVSEFKMLENIGYLKVENKKIVKSTNTITNIKEGDELTIASLNINEGKTTPPNRFTYATLIQAMKNPIKYVSKKEDKNILKEVEGIGTEATRAEIIKQLEKQELIELKDKKNIIPTEKGKYLIQTIPSDIIKSVELTANLEKKLKMVSNGKYSSTSLMNEIEEMIVKFISDIKNGENKKMSLENSAQSVKKEIQNTNEVIGKCPKCGNEIIVNDYGYFCLNKECKVKIFTTQIEKSLGYKKITKTQAKELLTKGKTSKKITLKSAKTGKEYEAYLVYKFDENKEYPNNVWISFDE